jgi:hypothetical protein
VGLLQGRSELAREVEEVVVVLPGWKRRF